MILMGARGAAWAGVIFRQLSPPFRACGGRRFAASSGSPGRRRVHGRRVGLAAAGGVVRWAAGLRRAVPAGAGGDRPPGRMPRPLAVPGRRGVSRRAAARSAAALIPYKNNSASWAISPGGDGLRGLFRGREAANA